MEIEIESGVPIPETRRIGVPGHWQKLVQQLEPGQSVVVETDSQVQSLRGAFKALRKVCATARLTEAECAEVSKPIGSTRIWMKEGTLEDKPKAPKAPKVDTQTLSQ